ncbi:MAG: hypothetical protein QGI54_08120 [Gammaproteobacteria bacterium]|nr:hypothetical protein [Gammaproteobacteria bacterium]
MTKSTPTPVNNESHIDQTLTMLEIAIAQIRASLYESNADVDMLTRNCSSIANNIRSINNSVNSLSDSHLDTNAEVALLNTEAQKAHAKISQAVVGFQFFDRMSQRLSHVMESLEQVSSLLKDPLRIQDTAAWMQLQSDLHDSYSMETERVIFESIVNGASTEETIALYHEASDQEHVKADEEAELF